MHYFGKINLDFEIPYLNFNDTSHEGRDFLFHFFVLKYKTVSGHIKYLTNVH